MHFGLLLFSNFLLLSLQILNVAYHLNRTPFVKHIKLFLFSGEAVYKVLACKNLLIIHFLTEWIIRINILYTFLRFIKNIFRNTFIRLVL